MEKKSRGMGPGTGIGMEKQGMGTGMGMMKQGRQMMENMEHVLPMMER
jgi:hypothetical protein